VSSGSATRIPLRGSRHQRAELIVARCLEHWSPCEGLPRPDHQIALAVRTLRAWACGIFWLAEYYGRAIHVCGFLLFGGRPPLRKADADASPSKSPSASSPQASPLVATSGSEMGWCVGCHACTRRRNNVADSAITHPGLSSCRRRRDSVDQRFAVVELDTVRAGFTGQDNVTVTWCRGRRSAGRSRPCSSGTQRTPGQYMGCPRCHSPLEERPSPTQCVCQGISRGGRMVPGAWGRGSACALHQDRLAGCPRREGSHHWRQGNTAM